MSEQQIAIAHKHFFAVNPSRCAHFVFVNDIFNRRQNGLLADYAAMRGAGAVVKGLRAMSDFEYEFQMALINHKINPNLDTMFLTAEHQYMYLSSSTVKELGNYEVDLSDFLPEQIIPDFKKDKTFNSRSKKAAIYFLNVEEGARGNFFIDLCMCHLLDYIRQQKASVTLPSMSVDVLANVDSSYQELRARCDTYILQSGWYGELLD